jgi:hypothetical protein
MTDLPRVSKLLPSVVLVAVAAALGCVLACNTPPREAHDGSAVPAPASAAPSAPGPAPAGASASPSAHASALPSASPSAAPAASGSKCSADADCRTWSSYCQEAPCACRVLASSEPDPKCLGTGATKVRCFADPCLRKVASCQSGACVLTVK